MKKVLFTLFAASLLMTVACNKNNDTEVVFPDPATKAEAVSIKFDQGDDLTLLLLDRSKPSDPSTAQPSKPVEVKVPIIELTEGNRYILYIDDAKTKVSTGTKFAKVWTGKYIFDKGRKVYQLEKVGEIDLSGGPEKGTIKITPDESLQVKAPGTPMTLKGTIAYLMTNNSLLGNLSRTWKVASCHVKISDGDVSFSKGFDGCDLHAIAQSCSKDGKIAISDDDIKKLEGYKVKEIFLEGNGSIVINFDSADSYYGTFTASGTSFSWSLNDSNQLISANAQGTVGFPRNGSTELVMKATVKGGGKTYTGEITFNLEQVNN